MYVGGGVVGSARRLVGWTGMHVVPHGARQQPCLSMCAIPGQSHASSVCCQDVVRMLSGWSAGFWWGREFACSLLAATSGHRCSGMLPGQVKLNSARSQECSLHAFLPCVWGDTVGLIDVCSMSLVCFLSCTRLTGECLPYCWGTRVLACVAGRPGVVCSHMHHASSVTHVQLQPC